MSDCLTFLPKHQKEKGKILAKKNKEKETEDFSFWNVYWTDNDSYSVNKI